MKTPERIYLGLDLDGNLDGSYFSTGQIKGTKEIMQNPEYIRFSKVAELMALSYQNGVDDAKDNLFTKEQVIELIFDFQFDFFTSVEAEFAEKEEIVKYVENHLTQNKAI